MAQSLKTDDRVVAGLNPTEAYKSWKFVAIFFTPRCQCLSEETLKAVQNLDMSYQLTIITQ